MEGFEDAGLDDPVFDDNCITAALLEARVGLNNLIEWAENRFMQTRRPTYRPWNRTDKMRATRRSTVKTAAKLGAFANSR